MQPNEQLLHTFYQAFQNKDVALMQKCYADDAIFNDEVFINLNADQVRAMWAMLIKRGRDLTIDFSAVKADDVSGTAEWVAEYTFSTTKKKVNNRIKASFEFRDGKIIRHSDSFDFYRWARQAFGTTGLIIGWTGFFRNKVRAGALQNLADFMKKS